MPNAVKLSADEAISKKKAELKDASEARPILLKAMKAPPSWDGEKRSARFVMSTEGIDRYGDIVITDGIDVTQFLKNPVCLMIHNSWNWPIGAWDNLEKKLATRPRRLEGDAIMLPAGGPVAEVDEAAWMIENGGVRACSIGFVPAWEEVEVIRDEEGRWLGMRFNQSELVECSLVPVPANPGALARSADTADRMKVAREFIEDVLDNYARDPVTKLLVPRAEYEKAYKITVEKIVADTIAKSDTNQALAKRFGAAEDQEAEGFITRVLKKLGVVKEPPAPPPVLDTDKSAALRAKILSSKQSLVNKGVIDAPAG